MQIEFPAALRSLTPLRIGVPPIPLARQDVRAASAPHLALRQFGLTLWARGQTDTAIGILKAAIALAPEETALWNDLAGLLYSLGRSEEARAAAGLARKGSGAATGVAADDD